MKTLNDIVAECMKKTADRRKVCRAVLDLLEPKPIREEVLTPMITDAINYAISMKAHRTKVAHKLSASTRGLEGAKALNEALAASILETWHVGSKRLGDLTGAELVIAARDERCRAKGHIVNASFYENIAGGLKGKQTVREKFKPSDVQKVLVSLHSK